MSDAQVLGAVQETVLDSLYGQLHPASLTVNKIVYAHESNSTFDAAVLEQRQGVVKISSANTNLGSTLSFTIANSKIQDIFYIYGQLSLGQYMTLKSLWFLDAVQNIQITIPGASGNIQYTGESWKSFLLRSSSVNQRAALNVMNPTNSLAAVAGATINQFCIPVVMPWSTAAQPNSAFPLDGDSFNNNILVNITLKPSYLWIFASQSGGAHVRVLPTQFDFIQLKPLNYYSHLRNELSVGKTRDIYRIPSYYIQSYEIDNVAITGSQQSLNLQSFPNAQLVSILVSVVDNSALGTSSNAAADQALINPINIELTQTRLNYNGLDLIDLTGPELPLMKCYSAGLTEGNLEYLTYTAASNSSGVVTEYPQGLNVLECWILDTNAAFTNAEYALSRNFTGQTMTLFFTGPVTASSTVTITYVCNCVYEVKDGVAEQYF